jgi:membrane protein required for beta-lactamase induction
LLLILLAIAITFIGVILNNWIVGIIGTVITLLLSLAILLPWLQKVLYEWFSPQERTLFVAILVATGLCAIAGWQVRRQQKAAQD